METYFKRTTPFGSDYQRQSDGAWIPEDETNHDYADMLDLVAKGKATIENDA